MQFVTYNHPEKNFSHPPGPTQFWVAQASSQWTKLSPSPSPSLSLLPPTTEYRRLNKHRCLSSAYPLPSTSHQPFKKTTKEFIFQALFLELWKGLDFYNWNLERTPKDTAFFQQSESQPPVPQQSLNLLGFLILTTRCWHLSHAVKICGYYGLDIS